MKNLLISVALSAAVFFAVGAVRGVKARVAVSICSATFRECRFERRESGAYVCSGVSRSSGDAVDVYVTSGAIRRDIERAAGLIP